MRWLGTSVRLWFVLILIVVALVWGYFAGRASAPEPSPKATIGIVLA